MMGVRRRGREVVEWGIEREGRWGEEGEVIKWVVVGIGVWKWSG